ncbi:MAG TPA: hypothetical protein VHF06_27870 [Pseudonocardiaceae bacterium]|nr:hypothetical protein [Pseudonocardiaceae bacterium]
MNTIEDSPEEVAERWGDDEPGRWPVTPEQYADVVRQLVDGDAPRRFAIVQDWGEMFDSRVAAWGMVMGDHTMIVDAQAGPRVTADSIRLALALYTRPPHVTARVYWIDVEPE